MRTASSIGAPSRLPGTTDWPIPSVIELPVTVRSFDVTHPASALPSGSASTMRTDGLRAFSAIATPASVPPVPQAQVNASTCPAV